jgi:hypothetical protein
VAALRFAPVARALSALLSQPPLLLIVLASFTACAGLLWWMRPRTESSAEVRHVGMLGF